MGDKSAIPLLAAFAASSGPEQAAARRALTVLPGPDINAALVAALSTSTPAQRVELHQGPHRPQRDRSRPGPAQAGRRRAAVVRAAAIMPPSRTLPARRKLPRLVDLVIAVPAESAADASNALVQAARRTGTQPIAAEKLITKLGAADVAQKAILLQTAGRLGHDLALPTLRAALADSDSAIVAAAIEALSAWPNAAPLPDLLKVAQTSTVRTQKILALRGYVDMIALSADSDAQKLQAYQQAMTLSRSVRREKTDYGQTSSASDARSPRLGQVLSVESRTQTGSGSGRRRHRAIRPDFAGRKKQSSR